MTQINATITLDENTNPSIIQEVLENMKGVIRVSFHVKAKIANENKDEAEEWINKLHQLQQNIDRSVIDMDDERTRYIMR